MRITREGSTHLQGGVGSNMGEMTHYASAPFGLLFSIPLTRALSPARRPVLASVDFTSLGCAIAA
jgi:hypothetical protein